MREILFRGKRIDNGEWVEGNLVFSLDVDEEWRAIIIPIRSSYMFSSGNEDEDLGFENWHRVDFKTVCQYTRMVDYEGNKIWENDIIEEGCNGLTGRVVWKDELGTYGLKGFGEDYVIKDARLEWEVIGNIFDSPELIKT